MNQDSAARKKPQKLKERLKAVAADAIIDAAEEVFLEEGLEAPMEVIAARAGVAVGTLYNHFKDRKALVASLIDRHRADMRRNVAEVQAQTVDQPARVQLTAMLRSMVGHWSKFYLLVRQSEQVPDFKKRHEIRERFVTLFGPVIERGVKEGAIVKGDLALHCLTLQALVQGVFSFAADEPKHLSTELAVDRVVELFFHGVTPRGGRK